MAYQRFAIGPNKGLVSAALEHVPGLVVIVGPNGAGKSTLLYQLQVQAPHQADPGTEVLYLNPNRPWRRTEIDSSMVYNLPYSLNDLYKLPQFPGFARYQPVGFQNSGLARSPDNPDDVQGLVKFSLARLADRRRRAIEDRYNELGGEIPAKSMPDAFGPLKEMVAQLLPHLEFAGIQELPGQNIRCLFNKLDGDEPIEIEIDDLSSGEKAIFQLLLPFIETQIEALLTSMTTSTGNVKLVAIIDEPELHLHPALQVALLSYFRSISEKGVAQFIVATHSTSIMDACEDDELYLLAPPSSVVGGNQLMKLSTSMERLDTLRELAGSTYAVTRCRPIVFIEGERPDSTRDATDERLIEMLIPASSGWVVVPAHGKEQVIRNARQLRDPALTELPGMPVFALVDSDTGNASPDDFVISWPVCMIENLLLDPPAIWEVLSPHRQGLVLSTEHEADQAIRRIAADRREDEIELRVKRQISPFKMFRMVSSPADLDDLQMEIRRAYQAYRDEFITEEDYASLRATATRQVDEAIAAGKSLEMFHGKAILRRFYSQVAQSSGLSYASFLYSVASATTRHGRLPELVALPVRKINQFVPADLARALTDLAATAHQWDTQQLATLISELTDSRHKWETGEHDPIDRTNLRARLSSLARHLGSIGATQHHARLLASLPSLGSG